MSIPVPTFRHTPLIGGNLENDYSEATANIKGRTWYVALKNDSNTRKHTHSSARRAAASQFDLIEPLISPIVSFRRPKGNFFGNFALYFL